MRRLLSILLVISIVFSLTSCRKAVTNGSGDEKAGDENIIKIGVFEPQSGNDAAGGKESILGVQFSHKKDREITVGDKKYKVKLIVKDNKSTFDGGKAAAKELVDEGVCAVIGSFSSKAMKGGYEVFEKAGIPVVSPYYSADYKNRKESLVFSLTPTVYDEVHFVAEYMINTLKISKVTVLSDVEDSISVSYSLLFKEAFIKYGGEIVTESFEGSLADFKKIFASVYKNKAYAVYAPLNTALMKELTDSAVENKLAVPVFTTKYYKTNASENYVFGKNINIFAPSFLDFTAYGNIYVNMTEWIERDEDRIQLNGGSKATVLNLLSSDAYSLIVAVIKQAGSFSSEDITAFLHTVSMASGSGELSFDEDGNRLQFNISISKTDTMPLK